MFKYQIGGELVTVNEQGAIELINAVLTEQGHDVVQPSDNVELAIGRCLADAWQYGHIMWDACDVADMLIEIRNPQ